jgi:hypothetical protein
MNWFNHGLYELAPWRAPGFFGEFARYCNRPGREGVRATVNGMAALPRERRPDLLKAMWLDPPRNVMAWKAALHISWTSLAWRVQEVAGGRAQAVRWFEAADWDGPLIPVLREVTGHRSDLPPRLRLFRGGVGTIEALCQGLSWSSWPSTASNYALHRWRQLGCVGEPTVIARTVSRESVLWRWRSGQRETIVAEAGPYQRLDLSLDRLRKIARRDDRRQDLHLRADLANPYDPTQPEPEEIWGGWPDDEARAA